MDPALHVPVLLHELGDSIVQDAGGTYVDCTFGRGGHAQYLLSKLNPDARLIALDCDPEAEEAAAKLELSDVRFTFVKGRFGTVGSLLKARGIDAIDGVYFDLGVSTPQLTNAARGFAFDVTGPLDMRMDPTSGPSAKQWVNSADVTEIADVLWSYGDVPRSRAIAAAIVAARPLITTTDLVAVVKGSARQGPPLVKLLAQVFQAIRIHINDEQGQQERGLAQAFEILKVGGRLGMVTFHSLEHALARKTLRGWTETSAPRGMPIRSGEEPRARFVLKNVKPSAAERLGNPSSRSAMLQVVERVARRDG